MADSRVLSLIDRNNAARERLSTNVETIVRRLWQQLETPYDAALTNEFVQRVAQAVRQGQITTAVLTEQYLLQTVAVMTGQVVPVSVDSADYPRPVPVEDVYERPLMEWRYLVSIGKDVAQAKLQAETRLLLTADTDLTLSMRDASHQFMQNTGIERYHRVTRGESNTCDLCYLASTRTYFREDLLPIHNRCRCIVLPDVMQINLAEVNGTKNDVTSQYVTKSHGELGPVLTEKGQHFRTEAEAIDDGYNATAA